MSANCDTIAIFLINASFEVARKPNSRCIVYIRKNFMTPFSEWGSSVSRLQSQYEEAVFFLPLSSQQFLVLI